MKFGVGNDYFSIIAMDKEISKDIISKYADILDNAYRQEIETEDCTYVVFAFDYDFKYSDSVYEGEFADFYTDALKVRHCEYYEDEETFSVSRDVKTEDEFGVDEEFEYLLEPKTTICVTL